MRQLEKGEMFMKKRSMVIASAVMMAMCVTACGGNNNQQQQGAQQQQQQQQAQTLNISFASGGTSGTYYPYATALMNVWNSNVEGMNCNVEATGASQENINLVSRGEAEVAIVQNDVMTYAYEGTESFEGKQTQNFVTMGTVYSEVCQIVAAADANIQSVADLKGKRVSIGDIGSGVEANAKQILAAYGMTTDDIKMQNLGFGPSADAIKDGSLDAAFITAGIPTTAVMELATTHDVDIVPIDSATVEKLKADYPFYTEYTIDSSAEDAYKGMDADVLTVSVKATLIVSPELDEETVYQMTKAMFENKETVMQAHAKGAELDAAAAVEGISVVPLHPGAERYYKEIGVLE